MAFFLESTNCKINLLPVVAHNYTRSRRRKISGVALERLCLQSNVNSEEINAQPAVPLSVSSLFLFLFPQLAYY